MSAFAHASARRKPHTHTGGPARNLERPPERALFRQTKTWKSIRVFSRNVHPCNVIIEAAMPQSVCLGIRQLRELIVFERSRAHRLHRSAPALASWFPVRPRWSDDLLVLVLDGQVDNLFRESQHNTAPTAPTPPTPPQHHGPRHHVRGALHLHAQPKVEHSSTCTKVVRP